LAGEYVLDPEFGFLGDSLVSENIAKIAESFEPVGNFLPAILARASGAQPGVVLLIKKGADFGEMAHEAIGLELQLLAEPTFGANGAYGKNAKRGGG
jgi:hypothetical protein